jgi:hypothetical protein
VSIDKSLCMQDRDRRRAYYVSHRIQRMEEI